MAGLRESQQTQFELKLKNFQYNTVLNSCNLSLPCLYNHLSVLIGKKRLLCFFFILVPAKCSDWFFKINIDILLLVGLLGLFHSDLWPSFSPGHWRCWAPSSQSPLSWHLLEKVLQPSLFPSAVGDMLSLDWSWMNYLGHLEQFAPTSNCMKWFSRDIHFSEFNRKKVQY